MLKNLNPVWDLDSIFPGGSSSPQLDAHLRQVAADIESLQALIPAGADREQWRQFIDKNQDVAARLRQAGAFIGCLDAQNTKDKKAKLLAGRVRQLYAALSSVQAAVDEKILAMDDGTWAELLETPELKPIAFSLEEMRQRAREKMSADQERLANDLAVDGYHGWSELYNTVTGRMEIAWEQDGKTELLSVGQFANLFSHPDAAVRAKAGRLWEEAWEQEEDLCAGALNHLAGFRLNLYKHRGWDSFLKEPLDVNRMQAETLDVMWGVVEDNKDIFVKYLDRKRQLLNLEKLTWYDVGAPVGKVNRTYTFDEAANFVVEQLRRVSPRMADFVVSALQKRWVEAENRGNKRAGAFCTSFPVSKETRVFMTFAGTPDNVSTLAHELGHAFHQHVMTDLPFLAQRYAMNVAETASTFNEMVVSDAAVQQAADREEKLALLAGKVDGSIAFFMNIHCRFLFETSFYEERRRGPVGADRLNELMEEAQKKAYRNSLDVWHPRFWCSKLHFYNTGVPFYNFPYTFGYLFSAGIYALSRDGGADFEQRYINLLRDTGRMRVEDLARRHLGVDLTRPDFWQQAVDMAAADCKEFLRLTE
ncbi:MAG: M3 family oligoendopeptidase [Firmicutes bacterium]|nr:M3 family oligoendopeptidase [Bacillota bacterium]HOB34760.1 M3 family oligoendopeptidase [Bacillota bacterium]HQE02295.1 M3 family oligoendopeptidase [Bacillota bacterium]